MLIVFIDALPASKNFEISRLETSKLVPNLGYSVNLHNELFNGKTPDEMGFFGEYLYTDKVKPHEKVIFKYLNIIEFFPFKLNYLFKIFLRKFFGIKVGQIPFKYIPYFKRKGKYPFINECSSMLNSFQKFITDDLKNGLGKRDIEAIVSYKNYINSNDNGNSDIFISLCDLDGIGHKYGTFSNEYKDHLKFLKGTVEEVIDLYEISYPNEPIVLLSDHGMTDVVDYVDPTKIVSKIESEYKTKIFYDSLYMQVFFETDLNEDVKKEITNLLTTNLPIKVFTKEERIQYGVTNDKFGNILGLLNDKTAFSPNLFGFIKLKAYHGYLPNNNENKGIFLHKKISKEKITEINSIDVYNLLNENKKA